ncbi:MAG: hypothetical protein FJY73_11350 [Candidatus Eisenbacteria bacterium]|nr:hypothetical protein [Candidatus Eisenbacteria bacterium]
MIPARRSPAGEEAKARRLKDLSEVYFSARAPDAPASGGRVVPNPPPRALIPVANLAGPPGEEFLLALRAVLEERGFPSLRIDSVEVRYRVQGEEGGELTGEDLLERIRAGEDPPLLFFAAGEGSEESRALLRNGDTTLLLIGSEVEDLRRAYQFIRELSRVEGGTLPTLVPIRRSAGPWNRLAPERLGEAAAEFLGWRLSVWGGGDPEIVAGLLAARLDRMRERREGGVDPLVRRLNVVLGGAP